MTAQPVKPIVLDLLEQGHRDEATFLQELSETERAVIGTPDLWSAKDHLAHRTFGYQKLIREVRTILRQEIPPSEENTAQTNAQVFESHRLRPWAEIHAESERVYADLLTVTEHLREEDLMAPNSFVVGWPLYAIILGWGYEHGQEHLVQYYSDRHDLTRAIQLREQCTNRVLQAEVPKWVKGRFLYNLTCFYAQQRQLEQAAACLQAAMTFDPDLQEQAKSDPELVALRDPSA